MPNSLEFLPGRSYYFISTSSPDDLHTRDGGFCAENNMKVIFKIADTREPVRTYQLEHRSGSRIKVVEDGLDTGNQMENSFDISSFANRKQDILMIQLIVTSAIISLP